MLGQDPQETPRRGSAIGGNLFGRTRAGRHLVRRGCGAELHFPQGAASSAPQKPRGWRLCGPLCWT